MIDTTQNQWPTQPKKKKKKPTPRPGMILINPPGWIWDMPPTPYLSTRHGVFLEMFE